MKAKEFKQIITDAGFDFDSYGYDGILNVISLMARSTADEYRASKHPSLEAYYKRVSDVIYKALDERGYYEEVGVK